MLGLFYGVIVMGSCKLSDFRPRAQAVTSLTTLRSVPDKQNFGFLPLPYWHRPGRLHTSLFNLVLVLLGGRKPAYLCAEVIVVIERRVPYSKFFKGRR